MHMSTLTPSAIIDLIREHPEPLSKRDIAKAFNIKGGENRVAMKQILKKLEIEGVIIKHKGGTYSMPEGLPGVTIVEVTEISIDGEMHAKPAEWDEDTQGKAPLIEIMPDNKNFAKLKEGSRALVRLSQVSDSLYEAHTIKTIDDERGRIIGMVRYNKHGPLVVPTDKKARNDFDVDANELKGAKEGDLVLAELQAGHGLKRKKVKIIEVLGKQGDPKAISLISMHENGLSEEWPAAVLEETKGMEVPPVKGREDLRKIPLVTIDGADARDFDDAVFAEKQSDGGFHLIVAIADVANYVRYDTALNKEALRRGNSTYFPDRVIPMLPEALSNDLCSLRPHEPRACMAVHMWVDEHGNLKKYKFVRGLMESHARLTYEQVQAAKDGVQDDITKPLMKHVIEPLYEAYAVLDAARLKRGALDLDLPEKQILINEKNEMTGVRVRERLDAHKLIEEFMILANVSAASAIEDKRDAKRFPCVYRVHDQPKADKLDSVRDFVESFGLSLPKGQVTKPSQINGILRQAAKLPYSHLISTVILRCQNQAVYSASNLGHFGLALSKYAHFTSPIRRYADLLVHRSLISAYGLGPGGINDGEVASIDEICEHISTTERASMVAERSATDRFTAAYLSNYIGAEFEGKISGVTRFGLFVTLNESGADGIVPMKSMGDDYYIHDEQQHALIGRKTRKVYRLGAAVTVTLAEADGLTGSTVLKLSGESLKGADIEGAVFKKSRPYQGGGKPKGPHKGPKGGFRKGPRGEQKGGQTDAHNGNFKKKKKTTPKHKKKKSKNTSPNA